MKAQPKPRRLPAYQERAVAVAAKADPRTVRKVLAGEPTLPMVRLRIVLALRDIAGIDLPEQV